ncbi:unnamed protein product [Acanthoscelides obtectus]|uniref:Gustatory receptor n=1 Tax=Acanthoscelides obtectus TaxID=200917 RepID=A0A9P0LVY6_ACAOB|nr:unnamed protein product [Acanthoscelides obtectus]CAK1657404.1 hypothetical protein AOBTE_LOCUS20329 [Acanthoscelides obtectus]
MVRVLLKTTSILIWLRFSIFNSISDMLLLLCGTLLTNRMVENQFLGYIYLIKKRFQRLNQILSDLTQSPQVAQVIKVRQKNDTLSCLRKIRFIHYDLCEITKDINSCFSWALLAGMSLSFLIFTCVGFTSARIIYNRLFGGHDNENIYVHIIWTALKLSDFMTLAILCSHITAEIRNTTKILFNVKEMIGPLIFSETKIFLNQIIQWDLKITAANFLDVDMTLIYNLVTCAATYIVIMIQMGQLNQNQH